MLIDSITEIRESVAVNSIFHCLLVVIMHQRKSSIGSASSSVFIGTVVPSNNFYGEATSREVVPLA